MQDRLMKNSGIIVLNKPKGMSSRAAVDHALKWFEHKIPMGHAGTLDPLATGVLVVCLGWTTKLVEFIQSMKKIYKTTIVLGANSATDDAEGPIQEVFVEKKPSMAEIKDALKLFEGEIQQSPPSVSAVRIKGKRSYKLARKGAPEIPPPKNITIHSIKITNYDYPFLGLEITCGKGTYIRSIARDLGSVLKTGGYVGDLERTMIGGFTLADSLDPMEPPIDPYLAVKPQELAVGGMKKVTLEGLMLRNLLNGTKIPFPMKEQYFPIDNTFAIMDTNARLRAIAEYRNSEKVLKPLKVCPLINPDI